ncbi:MAG TPA: hypothetical protein DCM05_08670 [Elusimicrobia bacterium]|nr:hypothetical protein [Elusimicrobiota bacterium]
MSWILLALGTLLLFASAAAWGASVIFHPPRMIAHTIWPDQFSLSFEKVQFQTDDGLLLRGWLISARKPVRRALLCCHGWGDNKGDLLKRIHFLADEFNLFLFDSRSHGESEGKITGNGFLEARDFAAALRFLQERRPEWVSLGLYGLSMGAVMAIQGMADRPVFACAAFESPYRSFREVVAQFSKNNYRLPYFPFVWAVLLAVSWRLRADPESCSPALHIGRLPKKPLLFIAAENDPLMPVPVVRWLYERAASPKEFYLVAGAFHANCWEAGGEEYRRRLTSFFKEHLPD